MQQEETIAVTTKRVAKNTGVLFTGTIFNKFCYLVLLTIAARYIGPDGFGKYNFAVSFVGLFMILGNLGINVIAVREVSKDKSLASEYLGNVAFLQTILSIIALAIIFIIVNFSNYPRDTVLIIYYIGLSTFFLYLSGSLRWCFQAFQKMEYEALLITIQGILSLAFGLLALYLGKGLIGFSFGIFITSVIIFLFSFFITIKKFAKPKFKINRDLWKFLIKSAIPVGLTSIFVFIYFSVDNIMLFSMKGEAPVGLYNAGTGLIEAIKIIPTVFALAIFPIMANFYKNSIESLRKIFQKSMQYMMILALPIGIGTTILAFKIIPIFWGVNFNQAVLTLQILIWAGSLSFLSIIASNTLIVINKQKINVFVYLFALAVNIILNLVLIPKFSQDGAAISIFITELLVVILSFIFVFKNLKINPFPAQFFKILLSSLLMALLVYLTKSFNIILVVLCAIVFYFLVLILIKGITSSDLQLVRQLLITKKVKDKI